MVGRYLERYLRTYGEAWEVRLGWRVRKLEREGEGWKVWVKKVKSGGEKDDGSESEQVLDFDYVIVATGFFGKAKMPTEAEETSVPIAHSSQIRQIKSLISTSDGKAVGKGRKIVVVGGQMSGVETAAAIAMQISSAANTPGDASIEDAEKYAVTHLVQKPVWVMPLVFPVDPVVEKDGVKVSSNFDVNLIPLTSRGLLTHCRLKIAHPTSSHWIWSAITSVGDLKALFRTPLDISRRKQLL